MPTATKAPCSGILRLRIKDNQHGLYNKSCSQHLTLDLPIFRRQHKRFWMGDHHLYGLDPLGDFSADQIPTGKLQKNAGDARILLSGRKSRRNTKTIKKNYPKNKCACTRKWGLTPSGLALPTLVQFPIIIGLYWGITKSLAISPVQLLTLRPIIMLKDAASLIPLNNQFLWMDLSQPERWMGLSSIIPESWPIIGTGIPILAIVVFGTSYLQTKLTATSTGSNNQTAMMTNMMSIYIPVLMAWLSFTYSAGLAVYFVASNIASLVQYALMGRLDLSKLLGKKDSKPSQSEK